MAASSARVKARMSVTEPFLGGASDNRVQAAREKREAAHCAVIRPQLEEFERWAAVEGVRVPPLAVLSGAPHPMARATSLLGFVSSRRNVIVI